MLNNGLIKIIARDPKQLFLVDGCGAILSAFLLGIVLVKLEKYFGIPASSLYVLATLPIFFAIYDFYCYRIKQDNFAPFLKGIAQINLVYCCISIGFAFYHIRTITKLGWAYIIIEILIVIILAMIELKIANGITNNDDSQGDSNEK